MSLECVFDYVAATGRCRQCGRRVSYRGVPVRAKCGPARTPCPRPGTELKALLKRLGIVPKPNCSCNKRARTMDHWGPDECERRIDEISAWLAEEAKRRNLPYWAWAGKALIRMAIRRSRKKGNQ